MLRLGSFWWMHHCVTTPGRVRVKGQGLGLGPYTLWTRMASKGEANKVTTVGCLGCVGVIMLSSKVLHRWREHFHQHFGRNSKRHVNVLHSLSSWPENCPFKYDSVCTRNPLTFSSGRLFRLPQGCISYCPSVAIKKSLRVVCRNSKVGRSSAFCFQHIIITS